MTDKVNILGTEYTIHVSSPKEFPVLSEINGYTDSSSKKIVVHNMIDIADEIDAKENLEAYKKEVLRHEIIHAFLCESGLGHNSNTIINWAVNEEMVDWFAIQSPKIYQAFKEVDCLE